MQKKPHEILMLGGLAPNYSYSIYFWSLKPFKPIIKHQHQINFIPGKNANFFIQNERRRKLETSHFFPNKTSNKNFAAARDAIWQQKKVK